MIRSNKHPYLQGEGLKLISYCPLCNAQYNPMAAKILEERDDAHLIHIECRRCSSSIVALILTGGIGVSSVGLITDLTSDDVLKFKDADDITADDVLDFCVALQNDSILKTITS